MSVTSERKPAFVERAVRTFLDKMQATVEEMPAQDFTEHVQSVATTLLEAPHNIDEQVECHWNTIWEMQYNFYEKYQVWAHPLDSLAFYTSWSAVFLLLSCLIFSALACPMLPSSNPPDCGLFTKECGCGWWHVMTWSLCASDSGPQNLLECAVLAHQNPSASICLEQVSRRGGLGCLGVSGIDSAL